MPTFLYGFGYEDKINMEVNCRMGTDYESSTGVFIEAASEQAALVWGREISEAFLRYEHDDPSVSWRALGYDVHSLVAVTNTEAEIKVLLTDPLYRYYRYCVDEWADWHHEGFQAANALLVEANVAFKSMHSKADDDHVMDDFEITHANVLLDAVVQGLETAKAGGVFEASEPFLIVWVSDSNHAIMSKSVRQLNSRAVATDFLSAFA